MSPLTPFQNEKGITLMVVVMVSAILLMSLLAGFSILQSSFQSMVSELSRDQVMNVALAGVEEMLAWLRSSDNGKPAVKTMFDPLKSGLRVTTPILIPETEDNDCVAGSSNYQNCLGIVRDFPVSQTNGLYAHYEINKELDQTCFNKLSSQDQGTSAGVCGKFVQDITREKLPGSNNRGVVWRVEVDAEIYRICTPGERVRANPFGEPIQCSNSFPDAPTKIGLVNVGTGKKRFALSKLSMGAEMRRMVLNPPGATLTVYRGSNVNVHAKGQIRNNSGLPAVMVKNNGPGNNTPTGNGLIAGTPPVDDTNITTDQQFNQTIDPISIFGMSLPEFKEFVQNHPNGIYVNNSTDFNSKLVPFPSDPTTPPLVYIEGGPGFAQATINLFTTNPNKAIDAYGVIVVDGINLDIKGGPAGCTTDDCGRFTGLVYSSGTLKIDDGAVIEGAVVSTHKTQGGGGAQSVQLGNQSGSVLTKLIYNGDYISGTLNQFVGNYSIARMPHIVKR